MKIILTQDVPKLGDSGTIQIVADGYARNYLIPQGLAEMATPGMVKQVEQRQAAEARRIAQLEDEMRDLAERIDGLRIEIYARVGEQGRLYGSVTSADIAQNLSDIVDEEIDRRKIVLEAPIREVGDFSVDVRLVGRLVPTITVSVFDPDAPMVSVEESTDESEAIEEEPADDAAVSEVEIVAVEAESDVHADDNETSIGINGEGEPE